MILLPVPKSEWRTPSQAQPKDCFGNENQTRFRIRARLHDGHTVWAGWFDDRDDADAFLWAIALGNLHQQPDLWRLPTPQWHPDFGEQLSYDFATVTFLTTAGSNQTYTSPSDWNNANNNIQCIGGGGGGNGNNAQHGTGGGGGAWAKKSNFSFATPGTTTATYQVGADATSNGGAGNDTWFNATTFASSSCGAKGGVGGVTGAGSRSGGAGGASASCIGDTANSGGRGGNLTGASGYGGSGGGGAAGPNGAGNNGTDSSSTGNAIGTNGGAGNANTSGGGTGGTGASGGTATDGGDGTTYDATHGPGGGGGGYGDDHVVKPSTTGKNGGSYGGGGGGVGVNKGSVYAGDGKQGIIVVTYTPVAYTSGWGNLAMMGM